MPLLRRIAAGHRRHATPNQRVAIGVSALATITVLGTVGYILVEGMSFLEALYMTVITLSTVGYLEVRPLSDAGHWYTIGLIVIGIGTAFYALFAVAEFAIEGRLREILGRRAMKRAIDALGDHVIVCGFGRLGRVVAEKLHEVDTPFVVVDRDLAVETRCDELGYPFICGSSLDDEVLAAAGIGRARALVAATGSDSDNVFIALSAREANPRIRIHARAESSAGTRRLRLAGASQVISPHHLGGQRIANAIVRPAVVEFLELASPGGGAEIDLEEIALSAQSGVTSLPLRDLPSRGIRVSVVAIKRGDEPILLQPGPDEVLEAGDRVIVVGDRESLRRLAAEAEART